MATSTTQLSLKLMRGRGYVCEVTERWNSFTKTKHDLFNFIDILCIRKGEIVGVQTTSRGHISDRKKKIVALDTFFPVIDAGITIVIHGWEKNKSNRWECKEVEVSAIDFCDGQIKKTAELRETA